MKILVRLSTEVTVKSARIRSRFVTRMIRNMEAGFRAAKIHATVQREWSRLYIATEDPSAIDVIKRTFGVCSLSVVEHTLPSGTPATLGAIVDMGRNAYQELVAGKTFAIRARRVGTHDYTSMDIARALGQAL